MRGIGFETDRGRWLRRLLLLGGLSGVMGISNASGVASASPSSSRSVPSQRIACSAFTAPSHSEPVRLKTSAGRITATLDGTAGTTYGFPTVSHAVLTLRVTSTSVTRTSTSPISIQQPGSAEPVPLDLAPIASTSSGGTSLTLNDARLFQNPIHPLCVVSEGNTERGIVLLGDYTGGAHCCNIVEEWRVNGSSTVFASMVLGDPVGLLVRTSGSVYLVTSDDRFAYAFDSFAGSGLPLRIYAVSSKGLTTATRHFPAAVGKDASRWLSSYRAATKQGSLGLGFLAAWSADECTLGRRSSALHYVDTLQSSGRLGPDVPSGSTGTPTGSSFVAALTSFLAKDGYC